eukprot:m.505868 g.505868  ORF g.505868 m.505868 type:complete len:1036 (+) comp21866_c0_seq1:194-3301(+)
MTMARTPSYFLVIICVSVFSTALSTSTNCVVNTTLPNLLPSSILPIHYDLHLTFPDPNEAAKVDIPLKFTGTTRINVTVNTATTCILLHCGKFNFSRITLDGRDVSSGMVVDNQILMLTLPASLTVGDKHELLFDYEAFLIDDTIPNTDNAHGPFLSPNTVPPPSSVAEDTDIDESMSAVEAFTRWRLKRSQRNRKKDSSAWKAALRHARRNGDELMIATQFEEIDARNMFPSFDEPAYKATFSVAITIPSHLQAFANTPLVVEQPIDQGLTKHSFECTKHPLPTYLVAVAVGHFDTLARKSRGVQYRIITPPGYSSWAELSLNASIHAAEFFGDRFALPYSAMNDKMDSISVGGIDMDAMENQGLLTYAPQMLLLNPNASELPPAPCGSWGRYAQAQLIVLVTTHEILHQWFGDTVTMRDWAQEYLNEGFARLMQSYGADNLVPEWDMLCLSGHTKGGINAFYQFSYEVAMTSDAPGTAPAIVYPLPGGGDIPAFPPPSNKQNASSPIFGHMFYEKGASVNRMVALHIGWDAWDRALAIELGSHLWQNPTVEDLMRALDAPFKNTGSPPAMDAMLPWLQRPGFPVITLATEGTTLTATQTPMSKYLGVADPWWIPLNVQVTTIQNATSVLSLDFSTSNVSTRLEDDVGTVVGDPAFWGFFIVRYADDAAWDARIDHAVMDHRSGRPDYTREFMFHVTLLVTMAHDGAELLTKAVTALTPVLASNPRIGGFEGEGAMYTMLLQRVTPIVSVLRRCGSGCDTVSDGLVKAMRALAGALAARLSDPSSNAMATTMATVPHQSANGERVRLPWPSGEDSGLEARDRKALRPIAMFNAVEYGDAAAITRSLTSFRNAPGGVLPPGLLARAAYSATASHGSPADMQHLNATLHKLLQDNNTLPVQASTAAVLPDIIFGVTTSAGDADACTSALEVLSVARPKIGDAQAMAAYGDMLTYAPACAETVATAAISLAEAMWQTDGSAATGSIAAVLGQFNNAHQLQATSELLEKHSADVTVAEAAMITTDIRINMDMIAKNTK